MKMNKKLIYFLFFIGFIGFSQENPVSISTNTNKIKIGEQIEYKIIVNSKNNVLFPSFLQDELKKVEIVEALPVDTLKDRYEKTYLLTSFDSGQFEVPAQLIIINKNLFKTKPFLINVSTVAVDTLKQKMFEIKSIKSEPKTFDDYKHFMWWIVALLVLIAVILYYVFRKKKIKEKIVLMTPIQEAFNRLKELDEKQFLQQNKVKIYYSELTDIVRTYIEKDINIPALESTTNELIETINDFNESSKLGISSQTISELKSVLQSADLVKFAKSQPIIEEIKNDRSIVEGILKNTQTAVHKNDVVEEEIDLEKTEIIDQPKPKKKIKVTKYALILTLVILMGILGYFGYKYVKNTILRSTAAEMMDKQWYTSTYGNPELSVETPEVLNTRKVDIPESISSVVGDIKMYTYGSLNDDFYIGITTATKFQKLLDSYDLDAGIEAPLKEMENSLGTIFNKKLFEAITINGVEGRKVIVEYQRKGLLTSTLTDYKLTMLFFADVKGLRQVIVSCLKEDEVANKISNRIINSVNLKQ